MSFNDFAFFWTAAITSVLFLIVVSILVYNSTKEKTYKYYSFFGLLLLTAMLLRFPITKHFIHGLFPDDYSILISKNVYSYVQILMYILYALFTFHFLDFHKTNPLKMELLRRLLQVLILFSTFLFVLVMVTKNTYYYVHYLVFVFSPILAFIAFYYLPFALDRMTSTKMVYLVGLFSFIFLSLLNLYLLLNHKKFLFSRSVVFLYLGVIIQNFCFAIGMALKFKEQLNNDYKVELDEQKQLFSKELIDKETVINRAQMSLDRTASFYKQNINRALANSLVFFEKENLTSNSDLEYGIQKIRKIQYFFDNKTKYKFDQELSFNELLNQFKSSTNKIDVKFDYQANNIKFPEPIRYILFGLIVELIDNVEMHSEATQCNLIVSTDDTFLSIVVKDNGIGFKNRTKFEGQGLKNIEEQLTILNGELLITTFPNAGTSIEILLPLSEINQFN